MSISDFTRLNSVFKNKIRMFDKPAHVKDLSETGRQSPAQNRAVSESW